MLVSVSMVERVARALVFQSAAPVAALGPVVACMAVGLALAPACLCLGAFVVSAWHGRCCRARKQCVWGGIYGFLICLPVCLVS